MKSIFLFITVCFLLSCSEHNNNQDKNNVVKIDQSSDLKVGGLYLIKNKNNTFYLTKVLAVDNFAVHLRTYADKFKTKPTELNSDNLKILIGHAPLDKSGFLVDKPELIKIEKVSEKELEGYKLYLESMGN
jgi:hypothetical protein